MKMSIVVIASVSLTIADMERSIAFYTTVLGCEKISDDKVAGVAFDRLYGLANVKLRVVKLQLGNETLELTEFLTPKGRPIPGDSRSHDHWFQHLAIVVSEMAKAYQHLRQNWVLQTSPNPQTLPAWNPVAGDIQSFYFKDWDGHNLELLQFPEDKGDPKWQQATEAIFLGIDHTAIVVADTATSVEPFTAINWVCNCSKRVKILALNRSVSAMFLMFKCRSVVSKRRQVLGLNCWNIPNLMADVQCLVTHAPMIYGSVKPRSW